MKEISDPVLTGDKAAQCFDQGLHCAEALVCAILNQAGVPGSEIKMAMAHATPFGGGMGKTFDEACGALSGALIAVGHLFGRHDSETSWQIPADLASAVRLAFTNKAGTTHCRTLRERFGDNQEAECTELVRHIARITAEKINKKLESEV